MGASLDPYELHSTRSTLDFVEDLAAHMLDMFPFLSHAKVNRQWAGMADMTPDFAPIMGKTPVQGFYIDSGWGTWGFKATPVCGKTMAYTMANDRDHELIKGFRLSRFAEYELTGEKGAASVGHGCGDFSVEANACEPCVTPELKSGRFNGSLNEPFP